MWCVKNPVRVCECEKNNTTRVHVVREKNLWEFVGEIKIKEYDKRKNKNEDDGFL